MSKNKLVKTKSLDERLALIVSKPTGSALVNDAIMSVRKDNQDNVIEFTKRTILMIKQLEQEIQDRESFLYFQNARLNALEHGKFKVEFGGRVIFEDGSLNG